MKIETLPSKEQITFFNAQYYYNGEGGKGKSKHVLWVTYSTEKDPKKVKQKRFQHHAKFYLKSENKEINRTVKEYWSEEACAELKAKIKADKKEKGIVTMFAFRMQEYKLKHKFTKGAKFHKRETDSNTCVFFYAKPDNNVSLTFIWNGEAIEVDMIAQIDPVPGQSMLYAYWTPAPTNQQLIDRIKKLKNDNENNGHIEHCEESETANASAGTDTGTECGERSQEGVLQGEEGSGATSVSEQTEPSIATPANEQLAGTGRNRKTSGMGFDDQAQAAEPKGKRRKASSKGQQPKSADGNYFRAIEAYERKLLDQFASSPFAAQPVERAVDLGTTFSFRDRV